MTVGKHICASLRTVKESFSSSIVYDSAHLNVKMPRGSRGESHPCETCGKSYKCARYLKRHITRMHSVIKLFSCDTCQQEFESSKALTVHARIHLICGVCCKRFMYPSTLKQHMRSHGDVVTNSNSTQQDVSRSSSTSSSSSAPFKCPQCHRCFPSACKRDAHKCSRDKASNTVGGCGTKQSLTESPAGGTMSVGEPDLRPCASEPCENRSPALHSNTIRKKSNACEASGDSFHASDGLATHVCLDVEKPHSGVKCENVLLDQHASVIGEISLQHSGDFNQRSFPQDAQLQQNQCVTVTGNHDRSQDNLGNIGQSHDETVWPGKTFLKLLI